FLSQYMYGRHGILTSNGIQSRYTKICTAAKRKGWEIDENYLITPNTPNKWDNTPEEIPNNPEEIPQSKVNESKEDLDTTVSGKPPVLPIINELKKIYDKVDNTSIADLTEFIRGKSPKFPEPYAALWNLFANKHGYAQVSKMNDTRKRKLKTRLN